MTEVRRVNIAPGQGCAWMRLSFPNEFELFLFSFLIRMEKNAFARSKVAYCVSANLLLYHTWQGSCKEGGFVDFAIVYYYPPGSVRFLQGPEW